MSEKWILFSKTTAGVALTGAVIALEGAGKVPDGTLAAGITTGVQLAGLALAIYGRLKARKRATLLP